MSLLKTVDWTLIAGVNCGEGKLWPLSTRKCQFAHIRKQMYVGAQEPQEEDLMRQSNVVWQAQIPETVVSIESPSKFFSH